MSKPDEPRTLELAVFGSFRASHALEGFEVPHYHLWQVEAVFSAPLDQAGDRLMDLVFLQGTLDQIFLAVNGRHLNALFSFSPTSERMARWVWDRLVEKIPGTPPKEVSVTLCDLDGRASGRARLIR